MADRILNVSEYRYGVRASDTTIENQYLVTVADATVTGYEVCRPVRDGNFNSNWDTQLPRLFDRFTVTPPDFSFIENTVFRLLPGGISAQRLEGKANQWLVTTTFTQTKMTLFSISGFKIGEKSYRKVAVGAYDFKAPNGTFVDEDFEITEPSFTFSNSAEELYDPADTQIEFASTILSFTMRQPLEFDYAEAIKLRNSINSKDTSILGVPAKKHQAKVLTLAPELQVDEDGKLRWYVFFRIEVMPEGETHNLRLQNQGYYAKFGDGADQVIREINVSDIDPTIDPAKDKPVTKPQLLDADGKLKTDKSTLEADYWEYRVYRQVDFETVFNFPIDTVDVGGGEEEFKEGQL